jgi:hypothetical protein
MPTYKFTYFNVRGLGEHIRFIFIAAGVPFEDDKIPTDKWPELKASKYPAEPYYVRSLKSESELGEHIGIRK